jgi:hypothetical protein
VKGHTVALALIAWTLVVYEPGKSNPWIKAGFPTKDAVCVCGQQRVETSHTLDSGGFTRMSFPPRCYYCHQSIRWPLGLVVFRGSVEWHVAHRACLAQKRAYPYAHLQRHTKQKASPGR